MQYCMTEVQGFNNLPNWSAPKHLLKFLWEQRSILICKHVLIIFFQNETIISISISSNISCSYERWLLPTIIDKQAPHAWHQLSMKHWSTDTTCLMSVDHDIHSSMVFYAILPEWVLQFNGLSGDSKQWGSYSPYKLCNHSLHIEIIIFPHIDNPQSTGHNLL